jgi:hypothetical protein
MPDAPALEVLVRHVRGSWRGRVLDAAAHLRLLDDVLEVVPDEQAPVVISLSEVSGVELRAGCLTIHGGDHALEVNGDEGLERLWVELGRRACALPEFTRAMRTLGGRRGGLAEQQSRFFAPLLQARRRLEEQSDIEWRLSAFDAKTLEMRFADVLRSFAQERHPQNAADRRSLEAFLFEGAEGLFARLTELGDAAAKIGSAADRDRYERWRTWMRVVRHVFDEADRCWSHASALMQGSTRNDAGSERAPAMPRRRR